MTRTRRFILVPKFVWVALWAILIVTILAAIHHGRLGRPIERGQPQGTALAGVQRRQEATQREVPILSFQDSQTLTVPVGIDPAADIVWTFPDILRDGAVIIEEGPNGRKSYLLVAVQP